MIDKICIWIVKKIKKKMPEIDAEKEEIIAYGIKLIFGEIPKLLLLFLLGFMLGIGWYTLFMFVVIIPYRAASGGFHLKSHLGCILGTSLFYLGTVFLSKALVLEDIQKYILVVFTFIFGIIMITLYAPADTENVPILRKKDRRRKKILSYIFLTIMLVAAILIKEQVYSNILILGAIAQTCLITRLAYKITNNKYGYEVYNN